MSEKPNTYDKAVLQFINLMSEPVFDQHVTPRALSIACDIAPSSGYRAIRSLEVSGFLRRDMSGVYQRGQTALKVGLSAFGAGFLNPFVTPVLDRLRRDQQATAFLAFRQDATWIIAAFSFGRGRGFVLPAINRPYAITGQRPVQGVDVFSLVEGTIAPENTPRLAAYALPLPLHLGTPYVPYIGCLAHQSDLDAGMPDTRHVTEAVRRVAEALQQEDEG